MSDSPSQATPKSRILTEPSRVTRMFEGFTSRWTTPILCAKSSPRQTLTTSSIFRSRLSPGGWQSAWESSMPSTSSIAM